MKYQLTYITDQVHPVLIPGKIIETKDPEQRRLAYPIKHTFGGLYQTILFDASQEEVKDLEKKLTEDEVIFRHLIVKDPPLEPLRLVQEKKEEPKRETPKGPEKTTEPKKPVDDAQLDKKIKEILEPDFK
jgi:ribosomal protein S6